MAKDKDRDSVIDHRNTPNVPAGNVPQAPAPPVGTRVNSTSVVNPVNPPRNPDGSKVGIDPTSGFSPQNPDNIRKRDESESENERDRQAAKQANKRDQDAR
jgi:hypothetical protein